MRVSGRRTGSKRSAWFCFSSLALFGLCIGETDARGIRFGEMNAVGEEVVIPVLAETEESAGAIEIAFVAEWVHEIDVSRTTETEGWDHHVNTSDDTLRVLLLDTALQAPLPLGETRILDLLVSETALIEADRRIEITSAEWAVGSPPALIQADPSSPRIVPENRGRLADFHGVQGATSNLDITLELASPAVALQFDLTFDRDAKCSFGPVGHALPEPVQVYVNRISERTFRILAADHVTGEPIDAGMYDISLPVALSREAVPGVGAWRLGAGKVVDPQGETLGILGSSSQFEVESRSNKAPVLVTGALSALEGSVFHIPLTTEDGDGDPVALRWESGPGWLALEGHTLSGSPSEADVGEWELCVVLDDTFSVVQQCRPVVVENLHPLIDPVDVQVLRSGKTLAVPLSIRFCDPCEVEVDGLDTAWVENDSLYMSHLETGEHQATVVAKDSWGAQSSISFPVRVSRMPRVMIDEVLADPPDGSEGDMNGDGHRDGYEDEFVEIVNREEHAVDISGWTLSDDDTALEKQFAFDAGTLLGPGQRIVLFGGGTARFTDDGRIGNGLTNSGDTIVLYDPVWRDTIDIVSFRSEGSAKGSFSREGGSMSPHAAFPGHEIASPGRPRALFTHLTFELPDTVRAGASERIGVWAHYDDGFAQEVVEGIDWVTSHPSVRVEGDRVTADRHGKFALSARWNGYRRDVQLAVRRPDAVHAEVPITISEVQSPGRWRVGVRNCYQPFPDGSEQVWITSELNGFPDGLGSVCWTPEIAESGTVKVRTDAQAWELDVDVEPRLGLEISEVLTHPIDVESVRLGEFIEIYSSASNPVDVSGFILTDDDTSPDHAFRFPAGTTIPPGEYAVLVDDATTQLPRERWFSDDGRIGNGIGDRSDVLLLIDPALGDTVARAEISVSGTVDASLVRGQDGWLPHSLVYPGQKASPGEPGQSVSVEEAVSGDPERLTRARITELHPAPARGDSGDTNGDGKRDAYEDEFIELENVDTIGVNLGGWTVEIGTSVFRIPDVPTLPPGERLVVFGGGQPAGFPGIVATGEGRIGRGLPNSGGNLILRDNLDRTVHQVEYGAAREGVSFVFGSSQARLHSALPSYGRLSPGKPEPRLIEVTIPAPDTALMVGDTLTIQGAGRFDDGFTKDVSKALIVSGSVFEVVGRTIHLVEAGLHEVEFRIPGLPPIGRTLIVVARPPFNDANDQDDPVEDQPSVEDLPPVLTVMVGTTLDLSHGAETSDVQVSAGWLELTSDTVHGTPEEPGTWRLDVSTHEQDRSVLIRVIAPSDVLDEASPKASAGVTWVWPIPAEYGMEVQTGGIGHYDSERNAVVWRPEAADTGTRQIEIAVNAPGYPPTVLTKSVAVGDRPALAVRRLVLTPDGDSAGPDDDLFVEIQNDGGESLDVGGWWVVGWLNDRVTIPEGSNIPAGESLVISERGARSTKPTQAGENRLRLISPAGPDTLLDVALPETPQAGVLEPHPSRANEWRTSEEPQEIEVRAVPDRQIAVSPCPLTTCAEISVRAFSDRRAGIYVYNTLGQRVDRIHEGRLSAGIHRWQWCPDDLGSGTYLIVDVTNPDAGPGRAVLIR